MSNAVKEKNSDTANQHDKEAFQAILSLLPVRIRLVIAEEMQRNAVSLASVEEIRLRSLRASVLTLGNRRSHKLPLTLSGEDLRECFRMLAGGSVYAVAEAACAGYIPLPHGYRAGVIGRAVYEGGRIVSVAEIGSIVIRVPHAILTIAKKGEQLFRAQRCGILFFSPPGIGKTTCLRSLAARLSVGEGAFRVAVIDERREFVPLEALPSAELDLLYGYPKAEGVLLAARTLSPDLLITDEIGDEAECRALLSVSRLGVPLIASAHAREAEELWTRPPLRALLENGVFPYLVRLSRNGSGDVGEEILPCARAKP